MKCRNLRNTFQTNLQYKGHKHSFQGFVMMALCLAVLGVGVFAGLGYAALQHSTRAAQHHSAQQQALAAQLLEAKTTLLAFAGRQGVNSHTHAGHLPCPAPSAGGAPRVACLQAGQQVGYWPELSQVATNYLNPGLHALWNPKARATQRTLHYAVSPQVLQPNALGWSRWVNWALPALTLQWPDGRIGQAVAVVAVGLQAQGMGPAGGPVVAVQPPAMVLTVDELQAAVLANQTRQARQHVQHWQEALLLQAGLSSTWAATVQAAMQHSEHLLAQPNGQWLAQDPSCQCQCTRTRCTCQCAGQGRWQSAGACVGSNPNCQTLATPQGQVRSRCTSQAGQACIMAGASSLASLWPVSRFEPVAAASRPCRPQALAWCPLSASPSSPCTCDYAWPETVKPVLGRLVLQANPTASLTANPLVGPLTNPATSLQPFTAYLQPPGGTP